MASLAEDLATLNAQGRARLAAGDLAVMDAAGAELAASGLAEHSLAAGAQAPDFALPDARGGQVRLSALLEKGPVVLAFYRGAWCPYCNLELRALQAALPEFERRGASLVAVSPQLPDNSLSLAEKLGLKFPVLSDVGNTTARAYGLVFTVPAALRPVYQGFGIDLPAANGDQSFELPLPATYVIARDGRVAWRFVNADYTRRGEPADVLTALSGL